MIDLSGAQPPWPDDATALLSGCADEAIRSPDLWRVPAPRGDEVLRTELGRLLELDAELLTITASVRAAALTYARQAAHLVVERPTFTGSLEVLRSGPATVQLRSWEEIGERPLPAGATLWLTSPARNPDGRTLDRAECAQLSALRGLGHPIVVNETYRLFRLDAPRVAGADYVGSLHKLIGVGSRIGWVHSPSYFANAYPEMLGTTPSRVWQRAWGLFLRRGGFEQAHAAVIAPCRQAAQSFSARLTNLNGLSADFDGPNALLPLADGVSEEDALAHLRQQGYLVSAGQHFLCREAAVRATFLGVPPEAATAFAETVASCGMFTPDHARGSAGRPASQPPDFVTPGPGSP